jgi:hypothetical protein
VKGGRVVIDRIDRINREERRIEEQGDDETEQM